MIETMSSRVKFPFNIAKGEAHARSNEERVVKSKVWLERKICERNSEERERESFVDRANHGDESEGYAAEILPLSPWEGVKGGKEEGSVG